MTEGVVDITTDITPALADVSGLGGFFGLSVGPAELADGVWRTLSELCTDSELRRRVAEVAVLLATTEDRVAASLAFQSLAARLVSPPLALAALHGVVPMLPPTQLWLRPLPTAPWPMWTPPPVRGRVVAPVDRATPTVAGAAAALHELVVAPLLAPLVDAVRVVVPVAPGLLWGNVSSSLAGAAAELGRVRGAAAEGAVQLVRATLAAPPLSGTGRYGPDGRFRRTSCCLYYRTPDGGVCGDCPFDTPPGR